MAKHLNKHPIFKLERTFQSKKNQKYLLTKSVCIKITNCEKIKGNTTKKI